MPKSTKSRRVQAAHAPAEPTTIDEAHEQFMHATDDLTPEQTEQDAASDEAQDDYLEIETVPGKTCACGCGAGVNSTDRVTRFFAQGHDQRLIGILAQASAQGRGVGLVESGMLVIETPERYGCRFLKDGGQIKLVSAIKRAADKAQAKAERAAKTQRHDRAVMKTTRRVPSTEVNRANLISVPTSQVAMGDEVKVRIGRHEYFARVHGMNQAGKVTAVEYNTKARPDDKKVTEKFTIID